MPVDLLETMYRGKILAMESVEDKAALLREWGNRRDTEGGVEPFPRGFDHLTNHYFPGRRKDK